MSAPSGTPARGSGAAGIEIRGLAFSIGGFSMEGLDLAVGGGEYCVLTGPNGAGKTLLIRLICGLHRPSAGTIAIGGEPVQEAPPWRRNIGYVPQDGILFPNRSVRDNIAFALEVRGVPREEAAGRARREAERMGIAHLLERSPDGLSGGERQKACIARAVAFDPPVLLLDEPVSAIDEAARDEICRLLRSLRDERPLTVLHVSHNRRETALVADRVVTMREGRIVGDGPPPERPDTDAGAAGGEDVKCASGT